MRRMLPLLAAVLALASPAFADSTDSLKKGTPSLKAATAMAFGPNGLLFVGDAVGGTITAIDTGDTKASGTADVAIDKLADKVGSTLGTTADNIAITDVKVNPASGNVYLAVSRGKGKDTAPVIVKLDRAGKMMPMEMTNVPFATVALPNPSDKARTQSITSLAFVDGKVYVAGLSSEEFASTLRVIPFPFQTADKGTGIEIYHAAHAATETRAPIRTFVAYKINGTENLLAAYTCTPLVKVPVADLKPGVKVKGTTIGELGNRNNPLDMIVYSKDGKDYVLMANSARGVMKIPADQFLGAEPITKPVGGGGTAGVKFETVKELTGVVQLDKLDDTRALLLVMAEDKSLMLKSVPLP